MFVDAINTKSNNFAEAVSGAQKITQLDIQFRTIVRQSWAFLQWRCRKSYKTVFELKLLWNRLISRKGDASSSISRQRIACIPHRKHMETLEGIADTRVLHSESDRAWIARRHFGHGTGVWDEQKELHGQERRLRHRQETRQRAILETRCGKNYLLHVKAAAWNERWSCWEIWKC